MECIGGVGYVEDNVTSRLYREAPVNAIWEGSGNVQCLDLLRVLKREPDTLSALLAELGKAKGHYADYDQALENYQQALVIACEIGSKPLEEAILGNIEALPTD